MIIHARHQSPFLARNMLDDPDERDLLIYLPWAMRSQTAVTPRPTFGTPSASPPRVV